MRLYLSLLVLLTALATNAFAGRVVQTVPQSGTMNIPRTVSFSVRANLPIERVDDLPPAVVRGTSSGDIQIMMSRSVDKLNLHVTPVSPLVAGETISMEIWIGSTIDTVLYWKVSNQSSGYAPELIEAPADMARLDVKVNTSPSPGYLYMAPNNRVVNPEYRPYLSILDNSGTPFKWKALDEYAFDFRVLPDGRLANTVFQTAGSGPRASSSIFIMDTNLNQVEEVKAANGYNIAQHSFTTMPNGNRLVLIQEQVRVDMTTQTMGGHPAADVQQALIQEIDPSGKLVFQWRSLDQLPLSASFEDLTVASIRPFHNNSVCLDRDGNLLLSMRHMSAIIKIDRRNGDIMWILGGKLNQFTFSKADAISEDIPAEFSYQHDIIRLANGHITMFDNGTQRTPQYSRGVEYEIDEVNRTCKLVWQYRHTPDVYASIQGSMQTLADGHRVLAWGSAVLDGGPAITEVDENNNVVYEANISKNMYPYKVEKYPYPTGLPSAKAMVEEVLTGNTYTYKQGLDTVGLTVTWTKINSAFYNATIARRYHWAPVNAQFHSEAPHLFPVRVTMELDGITENYGEYRFDATRLGLLDVASSVVVYRRDDLSGSGYFVPMKTRYNANDKAIVVDSMPAGEFAFGLAVVSTPSITPRLLSPVFGARVLKNANVMLRISPRGRATLNHFIVTNSNGDVIHDTICASDKDSSLVVDREGLYSWRAASIQVFNGDSVEGPFSDLETFMVGDAYLTIKYPAAPTEWSLDRSYPIGWQTNVSGIVRLDLMKDNQIVATIAEGLQATLGGYLWKVPVSTPPGTGYSIRAVATTSNGTVLDSTLGHISIITTGVQETTSQVAVNVMPNPAADYIFVSSEEPVSNVTVYSLSGIPVTSQGAVGMGSRIDLTSVAAGQYFVAVTTPFGVSLHQISILR